MQLRRHGVRCNVALSAGRAHAAASPGRGHAAASPGRAHAAASPGRAHAAASHGVGRTLRPRRVGRRPWHRRVGVVAAASLGPEQCGGTSWGGALCGRHRRVGRNPASRGTAASAGISGQGARRGIVKGTQSAASPCTADRRGIVAWGATRPPRGMGRPDTAAPANLPGRPRQAPCEPS